MLSVSGLQIAKLLVELFLEVARERLLAGHAGSSRVEVLARRSDFLALLLQRLELLGHFMLARFELQLGGLELVELRVQLCGASGQLVVDVELALARLDLVGQKGSEVLLARECGRELGPDGFEHRVPVAVSVRDRRRGGDRLGGLEGLV